MRRTLGKAHEWTPAEKLGFWIGENFVVILSCAGAILVFWFFTNLFVNKFINFLALGTKMDDTATLPYAADDPVALVFKILGSLFIAWLFLKRRLIK